MVDLVESFRASHISLNMDVTTTSCQHLKFKVAGATVMQHNATNQTRMSLAMNTDVTTWVFESLTYESCVGNAKQSVQRDRSC